MFTYYKNYVIILSVRDFFKILIVGIILFSTSAKSFAEDYKVLVIPDNIVTENIAVDSYIYNASAEFFADEIVNILNKTDYITAPSISEVRKNLKEDTSAMITAKNLTNKFRTTYNIDYVALKKLADKSEARYVVLLTSYIDSENYILRRTLWDFLNIPGATVIDPAYKISTYAILVDTQNSVRVWSDTYYKTISVCENRIITRGPSPQTEQLQKIRDYSKYISPQIAQNVQKNVLPADLYAQESTQIDYGLMDIDNVFTKKAKEAGKGANKAYKKTKEGCQIIYEDTKVKVQDTAQKIKEANEERKLRNAEKENAKLEVKATPVYEDAVENKVDDNTSNPDPWYKNISFKKKKAEPSEVIENTIYELQKENELEGIEIKKKWKNNLYGDTQTERPELRDYHN